MNMNAITTQDLIATIANYPTSIYAQRCAVELDRRCGAGTAAQFGYKGSTSDNFGNK